MSSALSLLRASSASGVQEKCSDFLKRRYRGKPFSPRHEMKWLKATRHPMTLYTPLRSRIGPMLVTAKTFSGLSLMPCFEIMNPKSMPRGTPEDTLLGVELDALLSEAFEGYL